MNYLHPQRQDFRFQTILDESQPFKATVPETKSAPGKFDRTAAMDLIQEAYVGYQKGYNQGLNQSSKTKDDYMSRYKNSVLSDFAAADMNLVLEAQQNGLTPTELGLQRNLLKQQYLQVAPQYLTAKDFDKQASANFDVDVGATLYKNQLEIDKSLVMKARQQDMQNQIDYMKEKHPNTYWRIPTEAYSTVMNRDIQAASALERGSAQYLNTLQDPESTEDEKAMTKATLSQAASQTARNTAFELTAQILTKVGPNESITNANVAEAQAGIASVVAATGLDNETANAISSIVISDTLQPMLDRRQKVIDAHRLDEEQLIKWQDNYLNLLAKEKTLRDLYGNAAVGASTPAELMVADNIGPSAISNNIWNNPDAFLTAVRQGNGLQGLINTTDTEKGKSVSTTINTGVSAELLNKLPEQYQKQYAAMSEALAQAAATGFKKFASMSPKDVVTSAIPVIQYQEAVMNNLTIPTPEEVVNDSVPPVKQDNVGMIKPIIARNLREGLYQDKEEEATALDDYTKLTMSDAGVALNNIPISSLRFDPKTKEFFLVATDDIDALSSGAILANTDKLNSVLEDPIMADRKEELTNALVDFYHIPVMTREESQKWGEYELQMNTLDMNHPVMQATAALNRSYEMAREGMQDIRAGNYEAGFGKALAGGTGVLGSMLATSGAFAFEGGKGSMEWVKEHLGNDWEKALAEVQSRYKYTPLEKQVQNFKKDAIDFDKTYGDILKAYNGTIDYVNLPVIKFDDGTVRTVNSMSIEDMEGKKEILIPTIINGKQVSDKDAIEHYEKTGENLGQYSNIEEADRVADAIHRYGNLQAEIVKLQQLKDPRYGNVVSIADTVEDTDGKAVVVKVSDEYLLLPGKNEKEALKRYEKTGAYLGSAKSKEAIEDFKNKHIKISGKSVGVKFIGDEYYRTVGEDTSTGEAITYLEQ